MGLDSAVGDENGVENGEETLVSTELQKLEETEKNHRGENMAGLTATDAAFSVRVPFQNLVTGA